MFRIVFVLDILNGSAVHAVRGERAKYKPVASKVCNSSHPLNMVSCLKPREVYIADLDRLQHRGDNFELIKEISARTKTMVDIGAESIKDIEKCIEVADTVILGTETASLDLIKEAAGRFPGRIDVSVDIKNGRVLTKDRKMELEAEELTKLLDEHDIKDIIVLDLDKVGTGAGLDIDFLKKMVSASSHTILVGGGIGDMNDIAALEKIGAGGVLVATAVHNGRIPVELIR